MIEQEYLLCCYHSIKKIRGFDPDHLTLILVCT